MPNRDVVKSIRNSLDINVQQTLGDLYRGNKNYAWTDFLMAVNYMISEGYLEGKGDGFVVHYSLTTKGKNELKDGHVSSGSV